MQNDSLDLNSILFYLPEGAKTIFTNIKTHCWENDEFIIEVVDRQIVNPTIIEEINKYCVPSEVLKGHNILNFNNCEELINIGYKNVIHKKYNIC